MDDPDRGTLRRPPHSVEAEQSVLGCLLQWNEAWDRIGDILTDKDFFNQQHRVMFQAMAGMLNAFKPVDVLTVYEELTRRGQATAHDIDLAYINALAQSVTSASNIRRYAEIVREQALLRQLIIGSDETATEAFNPQGASVPDLVDKAVARFTDMQAGSTRSRPTSIDKIVVERLDHYNAVHEGEPNGEAWSTGIPELDRKLMGGLKPGKVVVIGARPNVGKTSLALAIAKALGVDQGIGVLFCSQEMPKEECVERLIANVGGIDYEHVQFAKFDGMEWGQLSEAVEILGKSPIWVDEEAGLTFDQFRAKVVGLKREGVRVVMLDYLTLCDFEVTKSGTLDQAIGAFTRKVKRMAKQLKVAVILLSQLSRDVDKRANPRPTMADLRDSGNIEADCDVILFLWEVRVWSDRSIMALGFGKNRQGKFKGELALEFQGMYQRWYASEADISPDKPEKKPKKGIPE